MSLAYKYYPNVLMDANDLFKFLWFMPFFILGLLFTNPVYQLVLFLNLLILYLTSKKVKELRQIFKFGLFLAVFTLIFNILLRKDGGTIYFTSPFSIPLFGKVTITENVLIISGIMIFQLFLLFSCFGLINNLINSDNLMKTLIRYKIPYVIYLILSISVRFTPLLMDDVEKITMVQRSRGLKLDSGNIIRRIRSRISILLPLLINSLERSMQLSEAIESRGFQSNKKRSVFNYQKIQSFFKIVLVIHYSFFFLMLYNYFGLQFGSWEISTSLQISTFTNKELWIILLWFSWNVLIIGLLWGRWRLQ